MITREADYAVRAILFLAKSSATSPISSLDLAKEMNIPYRFMRRIGLKLQKSGYIESRKGKGGGIKLIRKPAEISILEVLKSFDEDGFKLNECLIDGKTCVRDGICPVHSEMVKLQNLIEEKLAGLSFDKLI